ncbi:hypothetical protein GCM10009839_44190 [Catenulispora yoronensis]|uniref:PknH-like extracellular domain-containing protein n=1 Tax=Catenulispora yoronensis TaxID=450799 RepID=A0ABN2UK38_9ACTN
MGSEMPTGLATSAVPSGTPTSAALGQYLKRTMPIQAYEVTSRQSSEISAAYATLVGRCLARFGFTDMPKPRINQHDIDSVRSRYGPGDDVMAEHGYHFRQDEMGPPDSPSEGGAPPTESAAQIAVENGSGPKVVNGQQVPDGGCAEDAKRQVTADGAVYGEPDLVGSIDAASYTRSQSDQRVLAVFAKWSDCMKQRGYTYVSPVAALEDPKWKTGGSADPAEIATAQADLACKRQYNVIDVWFAVDSAMQQAAIEQNATQLNAIKDGIAKELKIAADVLGAGGTG